MLLGRGRQQGQLARAGSLAEAEAAADFPDESSAPYFARLKIEHKDENQQPGNQNLRLEQIDAHHFPHVTDRTVERRYADCELGQELHVRFEERLIEDLIFQLVFHSPVPPATIVTTTVALPPLFSFTTTYLQATVAGARLGGWGSRKGLHRTVELKVDKGNSLFIPRLGRCNLTDAAVEEGLELGQQVGGIFRSTLG